MRVGPNDVKIPYIVLVCQALCTLLINPFLMIFGKRLDVVRWYIVNKTKRWRF